MAKLYGLSIGPLEVIIIVSGGYFQSLASAGMPAAVSVGFLAGIFRPLGLPIETIEVLLIAVMPLLDPLLTLSNVTGYVVSTSIFSRLTQQSVESRELPFHSVASVVASIPGKSLDIDG